MAYRRPPGWSFLVVLAAAGLAAPGALPSPVTETDVELLRNVSENITCFSRTFEDLTCFWQEEERGEVEMYQLFYNYEDDEATQCPITVEDLGSGSSRYICSFPEEDVRLFIKMYIKVVDVRTNETRYKQEVEVENVGLIDPPKNVSAVWTGRQGQIRVRWELPPDEYSNFYNFEVQYSPTSSSETPQMREVEGAVTYDLSDLQPGVAYDIRVCTKPNGESMKGFWGPWSEVVSMVTPHNADVLHLNCSTPDLEHVTCEWRDGEYPGLLSHKLYYQYRGTDWELCLPSRIGLQMESSVHKCEFPEKTRSQISVIVNVTTVTKDVVTFCKEPFEMEQAVRPHAPQILSSNVSDDRLTLHWAPPLPPLEGHLMYEIRYSGRNASDWKTLIVRHGANSATIDLRYGTQYSVQMRSKPDGKQYKGFWSTWSDVLDVTVPMYEGWILLLVAAACLLFITMLFLLLRCTFPAMFSKFQGKIWPPVPNLHRVLDGFMAEIQKQYQPTQSFYEKPSEDLLLPCLLEVLSEKNLPLKGEDDTPDAQRGKLTQSMAWPVTGSLPENPPLSEPGRQHSLQQDYVVLAPSGTSTRRYENEYSNGALAHTLNLGVLFLSIPRNPTESIEDSQEGKDRHYTSFTRPWPGQDVYYEREVYHERVAIWGVSDPGEREGWTQEPMNTTDIANHSYLLMAETSNWGQ
ncbi:thrombopoietin receptor [Lissotriton helveticus]